MKHTYKTKGTCCSSIELEIENDLIRTVAFKNGCHGNLQGISGLVTGMPVADVITKLEGIRCEARYTSCPDQLCKALHEMGY
ncbi:hypothetical protein EZS27_011450 [termite gut metagenome]|uniref:ribonucleoside-diphosphate reductase n=1 Tax=termite gut metagenome TaxID=433724 RepID=A0A5J4S4K4_9ZZZZ